MKVSSVMNPNVETVRADDTLAQAAMVMWRKDCGLVPVVDESDRRVLGAITDRDICMATSTKSANPDAVKVKETMASQVVTICGDEEVETALDRMKEHQVHRLPVVDRADRLTGIISFSDIVRMASTDGRMRSIGDHDLVATYRTIKAPREGDEAYAADRAFGETREG
jgi:CBS domain-containing protein